MNEIQVQSFLRQKPFSVDENYKINGECLVYDWFKVLQSNLIFKKFLYLILPYTSINFSITWSLKPDVVSLTGSYF